MRSMFPILLLPFVLAGGFTGSARAQFRDHPTTLPARNPNLPTLWIIGDSTVHNPLNGLAGWGDVIGELFDRSRINVVNLARGGRSSRTFITEGIWDLIRPEIRRGDFVLMQFGHNDGGPLAGDNRERGTLRGAGEQTQEVTLTLPPRTGRKEIVHTYGWYLRQYIRDAKARGATPIVLSPIPRNMWSKDRAHVLRDNEDYGKWCREVAEAEGAAFIDLNGLVAGKYHGIGPDRVSREFFLQDHTHTTPAGAKLNAACIIEGLNSLKRTHGAAAALLSTYLSPAGVAAVAATQPATSTVTLSCPGEVPDGYTRSIPLPEGNYNVTVVLGSGHDRASVTTVRAEQRRLMLQQVRVPAGQSESRTFTVNVRTPRIPATTGGGGASGQIHLKPREAAYLNWDDQLTLEFTGQHPFVRSIEIALAPDAVTLFLAGDSTVTDQQHEPYASWGQMLPRFFKPGLAVANYAESGESLRSFIAERRLEKVLSVIRPGDWLFIQFGHNDQKEKGPDVGAFTTYKADLVRLITDARQRGAFPVLITPVARRHFDSSGKIIQTLGDYPAAVRQAAGEQHVSLIDLNAMSTRMYEAWGAHESKRAFAPGDNTHHDDYGSYELARCVVEGIRQDKLDLARFLADDVPRFDPAHPDPMDQFDLPASAAATGPTTRPEGN